MQENIFFNHIKDSPLNGGLRMEDYWVWCGSAIQGEDGRYHLFASRWPKRYLMHPGWTFHSEIIRASSDQAEGPYTFEEVVFEQRDSRYFDARVGHNPSIHKHGDTFLLFYVGVSYEEDFSDPESIKMDIDRYSLYWNRKKTGLATSKSIFGPWERPDEPLLQSMPGSWDETIISNPAPCIRDDGSVYLIYKSNKLTESARGPFSLGLATAEHWSQPFKRATTTPVFDGNIEDPYIWHQNGKFYGIMKDMSGAICGEKHGGIFASSDNCLDWEFAQPPLAYSRTVSWDDGETRAMGFRERPQLLIQDGKPTHLFNATGNGSGANFNACEATWCMCTPLGDIG